MVTIEYDETVFEANEYDKLEDYLFSLPQTMDFTVAPVIIEEVGICRRETKPLRVGWKVIKSWPGEEIDDKWWKSPITVIKRG